MEDYGEDYGDEDYGEITVTVTDYGDSYLNEIMVTDYGDYGEITV